MFSDIFTFSDSQNVHQMIKEKIANTLWTLWAKEVFTS